jgi:hypothetical protein
LAELGDCLQLRIGSWERREETFCPSEAAQSDLRRKTVDNSDELMVLQERIELSTSPLPKYRSPAHTMILLEADMQELSVFAFCSLISGATGTGIPKMRNMLHSLP